MNNHYATVNTNLFYLLAFILCPTLLLAQPANDECHNAILLDNIIQDCSEATAFTNEGATPTNFSENNCTSNNGADVWFRFTAIATGISPGEGFEAWRAYNRTQPDMDVGALMKRGTPILNDAEAAAYAAPFPDITYKAGVRRFPELVMTDPDMEGVDTSKRAAKWWSEEWDGPSFMAVGAQDPVLGPGQMQALRKLIRNCPEPMMVEDGGHFVQEWGEPIARAALESWGDL